MTSDRIRNVRSEYEAAWSWTEAAIERHINGRETNLSRLLNLSYRDSIGVTPPGERISLLYGSEVPAPYLSANRIVRDWIADMIIAEADGVDAIAETGSGWGYNLFNIWLRGAPKVKFHALELTEAGRRCCTKLSKVAQGGPDISVDAFDYLSPDFSPLAGKYRSILVYSSHSIEQVEELPRTFFDQLCGIADEVIVMHFEPVGWQLPPDENGQLIVDRGQRSHAAKYNYNRNLWDSLMELRDNRRVKIDLVLREPMAVKLYNGTSLIKWRSVRLNEDRG